MIRYWMVLIVSWSTVVLSVIGLALLIFIGYSTTVWSLNIGLIGLCLSICVLGLNNASSATDSRKESARYNDLSKKLDTIASRQEDLISLVQSSSLHSSEETPSLDSLTNSVDSIEAAIDRVRISLNSENRA